MDGHKRSLADYEAPRLEPARSCFGPDASDHSGWAKGNIVCCNCQSET